MVVKEVLRLRGLGWPSWFARLTGSPVTAREAPAAPAAGKNDVEFTPNDAHAAENVPAAVYEQG